MRISLSNLLLLVTLAATAMGWWCDHRRLQDANARLNEEVTELFSNRFLSRYGNGFPTTGTTGKSILLYSVAEDRKQLLKMVEQSQP